MWWARRCTASKTGARRHCHACGLKERTSGARSAASRTAQQRGPSALWFTPARCFATSAPSGRQRQSTRLGVELLVSAIPAATPKRSRSPGPADSPGIGIWPWRFQTPSRCLAIAGHYRSVARWNGRSPPRPARPEAQGRISTNPLRILDSKKSRDPGPARRRTPACGDLSQRQQPAAL